MILGMAMFSSLRLFSALVPRSDGLRPALVEFAHALFAPRKLPLLKLVHHVCAPALLEVNPSAASGRAPVHRSTPNCRAVISCPHSLQRARPAGEGERQVGVWAALTPCPPSRASYLIPATLTRSPDPPAAGARAGSGKGHDRGYPIAVTIWLTRGSAQLWRPRSVLFAP